MKRLAFIIAAAALLVSAPRLALAFLLADGVSLSPTVEVIVYAGTGIAAGVVLTGGNIYIAHALAQHYRRRGALWGALLLAWALFLGFAVELIAPALVAGLQHSELASVLTTPGQRWAWAVVAALSVEVLAAAAMAASVLSDEPSTRRSALSDEPSTRRSALSETLNGVLLRWLAPSTAPARAELPASALPALPAEAATMVSAQPTAADTLLTDYACRIPGCLRRFTTPQARSAHEGRAHSTARLEVPA